MKYLLSLVSITDNDNKYFARLVKNIIQNL
jgi:hypothetical protein